MEFVLTMVALLIGYAIIHTVAKKIQKHREDKRVQKFLENPSASKAPYAWPPPPPRNPNFEGYSPPMPAKPPQRPAPTPSFATPAKKAETVVVTNPSIRPGKPKVDEKTGKPIRPGNPPKPAKKK